MTQDQPKDSPTHFSSNPKLAITDEKFYQFILQPQLTYLLHKRNLVARLQNVPEKEQMKLLTQHLHIRFFVSKTTSFPGFRRYVRSETRKKDLYFTHIKELGYLVAIDLLYGEKATLRKTKEKPREDHVNSTLIYERVSNKTTKRMFSYYPGLLSKPLRETMMEMVENNEQPFNTSYTSIPDVDSDLPDLDSILIPPQMQALEMLIAESNMERHANYRLVEPYDIEELVLFHEHIKAGVEGLIEQFGEPPQENQWIKHHLLTGTTLTESLYHVLMLAVLERWFRKKKPSVRMDLLKTRFNLNYTRQDAENAVKYSNQWITDKVALFDTLNRGVTGLNQMEMYEQGAWIYEECLSQIELDPYDKGLCLNNLGEQNYYLKKHRKNKIFLQQALQVFTELGSEYDQAITIGYITRAHYNLSENDLAEQTKKQAIELLDAQNENGYRMSWAYIRHADVANFIGDSKWELESLSKGLDHASESKDERNFYYINERLTAIHSGLDTKLLEQEGKIERPRLSTWVRLGSSFHPRMPSKDTKPV